MVLEQGRQVCILTAEAVLKWLEYRQISVSKLRKTSVEALYKETKQAQMVRQIMNLNKM